MGHHADAVARSPPLTERVQNVPAHPHPRAATVGPWSMAGALRMVGARTHQSRPW